MTVVFTLNYKLTSRLLCTVFGPTTADEGTCKNVLFSAFHLSSSPSNGSPYPPLLPNRKLPAVLRDQNPAYKTGPYPHLIHFALMTQARPSVRNGDIHLRERCQNSHNQNTHFLKQYAEFLQLYIQNLSLEPRPFTENVQWVENIN
jgi:hypothetical protein